MTLPEFQELGLDQRDETGKIDRGGGWRWSDEKIAAIELRELTFVRAVCKGIAPAQAYLMAMGRAAGDHVSPSTVKSYLRRPSVQALLHDRVEKAAITDAYVLLNLKEIIEFGENEMARVKALGLLAEIGGMLNPRRDVKDINISVRVISGKETPTIEGEAVAVQEH